MAYNWAGIRKNYDFDYNGWDNESGGQFGDHVDVTEALKDAESVNDEIGNMDIMGRSFWKDGIFDRGTAAATLNPGVLPLTIASGLGLPLAFSGVKYALWDNVEEDPLRFA
jgi:hypothetical protein